MSTDIQSHYDAYYRARSPTHVYPVEFVVRAFLGSYPRLQRDLHDYRGQRILDLGFGDGRNMPLLCNLGMEVHGVEISEEICAIAQERLARLDYSIVAKVGRNAQIPYEDAFFDHVLACHACYYVDEDTTFEDNLREIARVVKRGGRFVFSVPMGTSYIMKGARDRGDGHMEISQDPYGLRNGYVLKKFDRAEDLAAALAPLFVDPAIGAACNDWWGIDEHVWLVSCRRA